jgi:hypothetical protein
VTKAKQIVQRSGARWIRPPSGLVKINVDAAISKNTRTAASAVAVARDEMGHFLGASALVLEGIDQAEVDEALAYRECLALATVRRMQGDGFERHGTIILEIKSRREAFRKVEFIYEGRHANFLLARSSVSVCMSGSSLRRTEFFFCIIAYECRLGRVVSKKIYKPQTVSSLHPYIFFVSIYKHSLN